MVRLRYFDIREDDVDQERGTEIKNYEYSSFIKFPDKRATYVCLSSEIQTIGLMCTVDLFPVPNESWTSRSPTQTSFSSSSPTILNGNGNFIFSSPQASPPSGAQSQASTPNSPSFEDVIHHVGNYAITESSKVTSSLVGATFVQPAIVDYEGKKSIIFVFSVRASSLNIKVPLKVSSFRTWQLKLKEHFYFDTVFLIYIQDPVIGRICWYKRNVMADHFVFTPLRSSPGYRLPLT